MVFFHFGCEHWWSYWIDSPRSFISLNNALILQTDLKLLQTGWEQEAGGSSSGCKLTNIFMDQSFVVVGYCLNLNQRFQVTNLWLIETVKSFSASSYKEVNLQPLNEVIKCSRWHASRDVRNLNAWWSGYKLGVGQVFMDQFIWMLLSSTHWGFTFRPAFVSEVAVKLQ